MATLCGNGCVRETCRSRANNRNRFGRGRRFIAQHCFVTGSRIHETRGGFHTEGVVQTRLITSNAGVDLVTATGCRLIHKLTICQHGASHGYQVGVPSLQHFLSHFRHINPVGGDHRDADFLANSRRHTRKRGARDHGRDSRNARLVPYKVRRNNAGASLLEFLRQQSNLVPAHTTLKHVHCGNAENNNEIVAHGRANTPDHLERKPHSVLVTPTPLVFSLICFFN